ncbi:hypothetical protein PENTCL1PPCAC_14256, partial [Pristionchus entomophagus]
LPEIKPIMEIDALVRRFKQVCDRWEEPRAVKMINTVRTDFTELYKHPDLLSARTKLDSSAKRIATSDDTLDNHRRMFVLFCDLMHATPEVMEMEERDQVTLARKSFLPFYLLMTALWSRRSNKPGICFTNGSYFPTSKEHQPLPDVNECASRCVFYLNEPIRALDLTEAEQAVIAYLTCFYDGLPQLSPEGCKLHYAMREKLLRYLKDVCRRTMRTREIPSEFAEVIRVSRIISLFPSITDLSIRASDNLEACEMLQIVKFDSFMGRMERIV